MAPYKEGHGVLVRRIAFVSLALLVFWGGLSLYGWLQFPFVKANRWIDYEIPVVKQYVDPAFVITWLLVVGGCVGAFRLLNREKAADFLIETDTEVRKVTWPTWNDAWNSSLVVLLFVVVVTAYIFVCDFVMSRLVGLIL